MIDGSSPVPPASPASHPPAAAADAMPAHPHGASWVRCYWRWSLPLFLLLGLWVRLPGLTEARNFWQDETYSLLYSWNNFGYQPWAFPPQAGISTHSYFTAWLFFRLASWLAITGEPWLVRLPFLLAGLAAIAAGWALGRIWRDVWLSASLAWLLALWPFKVYWDMTVRFYTTMMLGAILLWLTLELYQRKPGWLRLFAVLTVVYLAPLNSIQGLPLLLIPAVYVGWLGLVRGMHCVALGWRMLRERGAADEAGRTPARWGALRQGAAGLVHLLLIGLAMLAAVVTTRGMYWTSKTFHLPGAPVSGMTRYRRTPTLSLPDTDLFQRYLIEVAQRHTSLDQITLGSWLGLGGRPGFLNNLTLHLADRMTQPGDTLNLVLYALAIIGLIGWLRRAPLLAISAIGVVLATALAFLLQADAVTYAPRYYANAGLALLILVGGGMATLLRLPGRLSRSPSRQLPRVLYGGLWCVVGLGLVWTTVAASAIARRSAVYNFQYTSEFYRTVRQRFPEGIWFRGETTAYSQIDPILDALRYHRDPEADPWCSPLRNHYEDVPWEPTAVESLGMSFLEQAQRFSAVVLYRWHYQPPPLWEPLERLLQPTRMKRHDPAWYREIDFTGRVFITRGRTQLPLRSTFLTTDTTRVRYAFEQRFEIPGPYRLTVTGSPENPPLAILVDGQSLTTVSTPVEEINRFPVLLPAQPTWRDNLDRFAHPHMQRLALPLPAQREAAWSVTLQAPVRPFATQRVELEFAHPALQPRPLLQWERVNPAPVGLVGKDEALPGMLWDAAGALNVAAPLRLTADQKPLQMQWVLLALDPAGAQYIVRGPNLFTEARLFDRRWRAGDLVFPPPLRFDSTLLPRVVGRRLGLGLIAAGAPLPSAGSPSPPILLRFSIKPENGRMNVAIE